MRGSKQSDEAAKELDFMENEIASIDQSINAIIVDRITIVARLIASHEARPKDVDIDRVQMVDRSARFEAKLSLQTI